MTEFNIAPIGLSTTARPTAAAAQAGTAATGQGGFGQWLKASLAEVNALRNDADAAAQKLITGESKDIHNTMIQMQKAGIAMDLVVEVRNKVISAYEEVKRMQF